MKIERKRAVATAKVLREEKPNEEEIAKDIAKASGVSASQLTQYTNGKVCDIDGDYFMSQEGLWKFWRLQMPDASSSAKSDSEEGSNNKKGDAK